MPLRISLRTAALALLVFTSAPASAELRVRVSKTVTGRYESVGITVTDPIGGLDAKPGPLTVTMADSSDRRQAIYLEPTGKAGEWAGRFTPVKTGRYTGTAILERGDEHEIGLVPLVRVRSSSRPGFLRLDPNSRRALKFSQGGAFFPVGVRVSAEDLRSPDWKSHFDRLRRSGVNYFEVPVEWPDEAAPAEQAAGERAIDNLLLAAELAGRIGVQLRLQAPASLTEENAAEYESQLQRWTRRWAYSPALAVWNVAGVSDGMSEDLCARFVQAVRRADTYDHLIALPSASGRVRAGADLPVMPFQLQRAGSRFAMLEMPAGGPGAAPLPGESSWQLLAAGGIGLPLYPYEADAAENGAFLKRMSGLARAARSIPFHASAETPSGLVPIDTPASFGRYGKVLVGWIAPDTERSLRVPRLPRGRYRAQFWDPSTDAPVSQDVAWSDGRTLALALPESLQAVYFQLAPTTGAPAAKPAASKPAPKAIAARKPASRPKPVRTAARPKPVKKTAAQLRAEKRAAAKRAAAERAAAAKRKQAKRKTPAQLRAEKRAAARLAARKTTKKTTKKTPTQLRAERRAQLKLAAARKKRTPAKPTRSTKTTKAKKTAAKPAKKVVKKSSNAKKATPTSTKKRRTRR